MHFVHMLNNHDYSFRFLLPQAGTPRSRHEVTTQFATCARKYHDMTLVVNQQRAHAPKQMSSPRFSLPRNVRLVVGSTAKLHTAPIGILTPCTNTSHYDRRVISPYQTTRHHLKRMPSRAKCLTHTCRLERPTPICLSYRLGREKVPMVE